MKDETRRVKKSAKIDISEWDFGTLESAPDVWEPIKIDPDVMVAINMTLRQVFEEYGVCIQSWPRSDGWKGPPVSDPATLYVSIPLSAGRRSLPL